MRFRPGSMENGPQSQKKVPGVVKSDVEGATEVSNTELEDLDKLVYGGIDSKLGIVPPQDQSERDAIDSWIKMVKEMIDIKPAHQLEFFHLAYDRFLATEQENGLAAIGYLAKKLGIHESDAGDVFGIVIGKARDKKLAEMLEKNPGNTYLIEEGKPA